MQTASLKFPHPSKAKKTGLSLFVLFFFFYITPNFHAALHTLVHEQGIIHTHYDAGAAHSHEDHASGKIHDLYFHPVLMTLQNQARLADVLFFDAILKSYTSLWGIPFQHDPPGLLLDRLDQANQLPALTEYRASHRLRAPPSA